MKKKIITTIIFVILLIVLVVGSTYAIYTWAVNNTIISGSTECFKVNYIKGQDIGSENNHRVFMPSDDYTGGLYASVIVSMDKNCITNGVGTLYLNTDESTSDILLSSGVLKYQIVINSLTLGPSGTISSTGTLAIGENLEITDTTTQYTVVVWIDGNMINDSNLDEILSSSYIGSISMKVESGDL